MCINNNKGVSDALDCSFNFLFHVLCTIFLFGSKDLWKAWAHVHNKTLHMPCNGPDTQCISP